MRKQVPGSWPIFWFRKGEDRVNTLFFEGWRCSHHSWCREMCFSGCRLRFGCCDHMVYCRLSRTRQVLAFLFPPMETVCSQSSDAGCDDSTQSRALGCAKVAKLLPPAAGSMVLQFPLLLGKVWLSVQSQLGKQPQETVFRAVALSACSSTVTNSIWGQSWALPVGSDRHSHFLFDCVNRLLGWAHATVVSVRRCQHVSVQAACALPAESKLLFLWGFL